MVDRPLEHFSARCVAEVPLGLGSFVDGVYEVYEAYEVDDVDENGTSIPKQPTVSSFCQGQSSFTQISQSFDKTHNG